MGTSVVHHPALVVTVMPLGKPDAAECVAAGVLGVARGILVLAITRRRGVGGLNQSVPLNVSVIRQVM